MKEFIREKPQNLEEIPTPEFKLEIFESTKPLFENLVKQMIPSIKNHEYNLIIGDDASGRISTLVIGGLTKMIYKEDKVELPKILFLAAGRSGFDIKEKEETIVHYLEKLIKDKKNEPDKGKALIVAEYIETGTSAALLVRALKRVGISCDIAVLTSEQDVKQYKQFGDFRYYREEFEGLRLYIGETADKIYFWGEDDIAGVKRKKKDEIFTQPTYEHRKINLARQDIKKMIDYLTKVYESEGEKGGSI